MDQLEQDLLCLSDIEDRIFQMSQNLAGTYDTTELDRETRVTIYRTGDHLRALIFSLRNLQKILRKKEGMRWQEQQQ